MKQPDVFGFLCALRSIDPGLVDAGLNGGCFKVYTLLKQVWPQAKAWYDGDHVITEIDERFWDIRGEVIPRINHTPMTDALEFAGAYTWGKVYE